MKRKSDSLLEQNIRDFLAETGHDMREDEPSLDAPPSGAPEYDEETQLQDGMGS